MKKYLLLLIFSGCLVSCAAADNTKAETPPKKDPQPAAPSCDSTDAESARIQTILSKMNDATGKLKSCQAELSYLFIQDPDLLDAKTLRTGVFYYQKYDRHSQLRIRFNDLKQEDFEAEKYRQEYLFDGVWLTRIDFKLKQIDRYQKAPKDKPIDVFDLISSNFPLIGFSNVSQLQKDFDIRLPEQKVDTKETLGLQLNTKKGSKYAKEYKKIDFRVNKDTFMPSRIIAYSSQGDIHDIQFKEFSANKKLKKSIFSIDTPGDFNKNEEPLKTTKKTEKNTQ